MKPFHIVMTAAHSGYGSEQVPLGGGAAVCERLCAAWGGRADLVVTVLGPGPCAPPGGVDYLRLDLLDGRPPSELSELAYARFCRRFERAATARIEELRPDAVLAHDLSEGPDFQRLARQGLVCIPLFHVDVVDFFNRMYLGGLLPPQTVARFFRRLRSGPVPDLLRLVFDKQEDAVRTCPRLVVPSPGMAGVLRASYPDLEPERLEIVPWGAPRPGEDEPEVRRSLEALSARWALRGGPVLLALSRISPEKGQDRLLEALLVGEERGEVPPDLVLVLCGEPAYMQGQRFLGKLRRLGSRLRRARVVFAGHVGGAHKRAAYRLADLFVSPSRHESYGLTTMEALAEGTPVVALRTYGAEATLHPSWGRMVEPGPQLPLRLWLALRDLLRRPEELEEKGRAARAAATQQTFEKAARRLLGISRSAARRG